MYVCVPVPSFDASCGGIAAMPIPAWDRQTIARGVVTVRLLPLRSGSDKP